MLTGSNIREDHPLAVLKALVSRGSPFAGTLVVSYPCVWAHRQLRDPALWIRQAKAQHPLRCTGWAMPAEPG